MVKFTDTSGKVWAVSKACLLKDTSDANHPAQTQVTVGSISFMVAQGIDDVIAALNA